MKEINIQQVEGGFIIYGAPETQVVTTLSKVVAIVKETFKEEKDQPSE